ncbi:hypothetical protein J4457_05625 [Candidatus Woesearchaeota archaeon]|nr:hypothetical protein [Candidatus Woesearchaeota archaeon]
MRSNLILLSIVAIVAVTALIVMMVGKSSLPVEQPALIPVQQDAAGLASAPVIAPAGGSPSSDPCPKKVVAEASHTLVAAETYSVRLGVTDAAQVALDRATGAVMQKLLDASGEIDVKLLTDANLKCAA